MDVKTTKLLDLIQKTQVFYSTEYSGEFQAPADLLELILENSETKEALINGVMFFKKIENNSLLVIDGMKRLISLSLLLHAICECYKLTNNKNIHAIDLIKKRFLFNEFGTKIRLNGYEKHIYEKIINYEKMTDEEKEHPMFKTLHEFWAKIKMNNLSATQLFNQIKQIKILEVNCDDCEIESRDLYQFLNCNNERIEEIQLITNFIEEKAKDEAFHWYEIVDMFKNADMMRKFRYFLVDFLTIQKNGIIPKENELYISFKKYYLRMLANGITIEDLFKTLKNTAKNYIKISTADFNNKNIKQRIVTIKENNMYETFPYLLEVTDDYLNDRITDETFCQLLDTVILFIAEQRSGNYESSINFATLSHEINLKISD